MAIVKIHNKKTGLTYAYEQKSYWVPELKQSRHKRKLIGRVDDATGEIIPTDGRNRKSPSQKRNKKYSEYIKKIEKLEKRCMSLEALSSQQRNEIKALKNKLQKKNS